MLARGHISIQKGSGVPVRRQLAEQIVYLIATGQLKAGEALPSVRELARRLKVHRNTVSEAYQELVRRTWLVRRRGSRLIVRGAEAAAGARAASGLDALINQTIALARQSGYSLKELRQRVRERLMAEPPDHILVVEEESGLRSVLEEEIRGASRWPVEGCSRQGLAADPTLAMGALIATPQYALGEVERLAPKEFPPVAVTFSNAAEHLDRVRKLREPSVVAVASVSPAFLAAARSLLAPAIGERHSLVECLATPEDKDAVGSRTGAADLVLCDIVAYAPMQAGKSALYRLIDSGSLDYLTSAMEAYEAAKMPPRAWKCPKRAQAGRKL
ncbi:MAG TPA: GntR family transcriptional regulator [Terriglobia bacterium]|nr:GntR family transcriptional regulator [Terriglobia bacterium]